MTMLLDRVVARIRALPDEDQDAFASLFLAALEPESLPPLDDATRAAIREGLAQAERGEFADAADIDELLADRPA